jgi:hypothetical protein
MPRLLLLVLPVVAVLASSCGPAVRCGQLCNPNDTMPCGAGTGLTCVSPGRCLIVSDAGPTSCPT